MTTEKYERPAEVAAELAALPGEDDPAYLTELESISLEVLVIARRQAVGGPLHDDIVEILGNRVVTPIRAAVKRHSRVSYEEHQDAQQDTMERFWEAIQSESFFEVRFNRALMMLARHVGERIRGGKQRAWERAAERLGRPRGEGDDLYPDVADEDDEYEALLDRMLIDAALGTLPEEQAVALTLHYRLGLPVFSKDPGVRTVASELGWSERKARQLIADGRAAAKLSIEQEEAS